jgi:hypothetical protein
MLKRPSFAQALVLGGSALVVLGLILWRTLPVALAYPPYLLTALLAIGYGAYEWWRKGRGRNGS